MAGSNLDVHGGLFVAVALAVLAMWLLVRAAAPFLAVLRIVAGAALACVAIGAALAFVMMMWVG